MPVLRQICDLIPTQLLRKVAGEHNVESKAGYDIELNREVSEAVRIPVIASGGAGNIDHMVDVLKDGKAEGLLAFS